LEHTGHFLDRPLVIPGGNVNGGGNFYSLDKSLTHGGVLAFIGVKQGQVGGSLEISMRGQGILEVNVLVVVGPL
jgi:hypothetical protein